MSITSVYWGNGGADQLTIQTHSFRNDILPLYTYLPNNAPACLCEGDCIDTLFGYTTYTRCAMVFTTLIEGTHVTLCDCV
jgi:hypothetical protein